MNWILNKYSIIFSFYYRINRIYYKTGHIAWTNLNCFVVNAGFLVTVIFGLIFLLGIDITSEALINIMMFVLVIDSLFVWYYTKSQSEVLWMLKEEEVELTPWMRVVHGLSLFLSYILPNFLYTLCLGAEFVW